MGGFDPSSRAALDLFLADNPELEALNARLSTFNIFRALRIEDAEIRHSNILAWLLDPKESHGLGEVFLRRLLSNILLKGQTKVDGISAADVELMNFSGVEVLRESQHIDILVVDRSDRVVLLIENKIRSGEGTGQLIRYRDAVAKQYSGFRLVPVFLTLEGGESEDFKANSFISYSHSKMRAVLDRVIQQRRSQLPGAVGVFLEHYMEILGRLTMADKELVDLCKNIYRRHRVAIDLIVEYGKATRFQEVAIGVLGRASDFEILESDPTHVWFIPASWAKILPDNGAVWSWPDTKRNVSIACWFRRWPERVGLRFEMSRMTDPQLRLACANALKEEGFSLTSAAFKEDAIYSRFYRETRKIVDFENEDELERTLGALLTNASQWFPKAEKVFARVFTAPPPPV